MTAFKALLAAPGVEEIVELRGPFGFMAYHGGALEVMTDVIAAAAARRSNASLYAVVQPDGMREHLASTLVRPAESARLDDFLGHVDVVVTIHGFGQRGLFGSLLLGGRNRVLAEHVGRSLRRTLPAYDIVDRPRPHPGEPPRPARRQPGQPRGGMRGADRVAAPRPWCQPDVVGLGRAGAHAPHRRAHRRAGRRRHDLARGPRG